MCLRLIHGASGFVHCALLGGVGVGTKPPGASSLPGGPRDAVTTELRSAPPESEKHSGSKNGKCRVLTCMCLWELARFYQKGLSLKGSA